MIKTRAFKYAAGGAAAGLIIAISVFLLARESGYAAGVAALLCLPALMLAGGAAVGHRVDRVAREKLELTNGIKETEEHFASLAGKSVAGSDWSVDIQDDHLPTCWEVKDCEEVDCAVLRKKHIRCWLIAGTYCSGEPSGTFAQKLDDCTSCEVYQLAVASHPVGKIREIFNVLLWEVHVKTSQLESTNSELKSRLEELEKLHEETKKIAASDSLTGLFNYGHFNEYLKREVAQAKRYGNLLSLMMLDFNNFKKVNEQHGYQTGDEVLKALARYLEKAVRRKDYIARYGNEEFVVVLPDTDGAAALPIAESIVAGVGGISDEVGVDAADLSVSIGVADFPDCSSDNQSLIAAADAALLFAKKNSDGVAYFCDLTEEELSPDDVQRLQSRLQGAGITTLTALARAVDATDSYDEQDQKALGNLAIGMAEHLELDEDETELLVLAATIHDIGKIGVPADVLHKTDKLSPVEVDMIKRHPEIGQEILREARQIQELVLAILYHHERWDGNGYPEGLEGNKIPRMARIVGIFDAYRAMRCDRPYRKALSQLQAVEELRKGAGSQFDPDLVELFVRQLGQQEDQELRETG